MIALTGSTGFLGSTLTQYFDAHSVPYKVFDKKKHSLADLESLRELVTGAGTIIHLAGVSKNNPPEVIQKVNVTGTENMLKALSEFAPSAKFVFSSSFQIYTDQDAFGHSKKTAEGIIEDYSKKYDFQSICLRFSNLYGVGGKPFHNSVISTFFELIKQGKPITIEGSGEQQRDYLYITDATAALVKSTHYASNEPVEYFDVCTGMLTSLNQVLSTIRSFTKKEFTVYNKPLKNEITFTVARTFTDAEEKLKWTPHVSFKEGIKKMVKEYDL